MMDLHGILNEDGTQRYCDVHGTHGVLYVCKSYPLEMKKEIESLGDEFRKQCQEGTMKFVTSYAMRINDDGI